MIKDPGEMTAQIRIQTPVTAGTGINQTTTWLDLGPVSEENPDGYLWAKWENVHGSEAWVAESVQATAPATVSVWYESRINRKCRVLDDAGIVYDIVSLDDIRKEHRQIEMKVQASVNG